MPPLPPPEYFFPLFRPENMSTMTPPWIQKLRRNRRSLTGLALAGALLISVPGAALAQDEEDVSVETLYRSAAELAVEGKFAEAVEKYEKLFDLAGEYLCEDYGPQAGGIVFDYGSVLLQMQEWEKARDAFERCHFFKEKECEKSKVQNENVRANLALFQWGFCESQLGNDARALELYDQYLETAKTNPEELAKIRNAFKLRRGAALVKVGRLEEGAAEIKELFDKQEEWQVSSQFLMQGLLEMGMGWVELARKAETSDAITQIEIQGHLFLDQNGEVLNVNPVDKFRFGFIDRFKKLGFDSSEAGMQTLALRFYSMVPTLEEVVYDINARVQILPGQQAPAAYQGIIDQATEQMNKPVPPDVEMQRLTARSYELLGNYIAPREIYRHLAEQYPEIQQERRAEILHEAARFSTMLGDYSSAQYFGEIFMAEMPDHRLRDNVSVFMLQSLFSSQQFAEVVRICETVRERFPLGDEQRELPDALYGLALYSLQRYEDAQPAFDDYAKTYKGTPNREMVMYHRANNRMILGDFRMGAELAHEFQQEFPNSEKFLDMSLADMALCRYNLEDYTGAISAVEQLEENHPDSQALDRSLVIKADSLIVRSDEVEEEEETEKLRAQGLETYLAAIDTAKSLEATGKNVEAHKEVFSEATAKAIDILTTNEEHEKAVALYDAFFPDYVGTFYEPQVSVYTMDSLILADRGEDGLQQLEKMIILLGNRPPENFDIELLRQSLGSYSDASIEVRGADTTLATLSDFPGLDASNVALTTWIKMQKVIVLQQMRAETEKDSAEYASIQEKIDTEFKDMEQFEVKDLSEIALYMIGKYLAGSDNPFLAVRYFEELLVRDNEDANQYKAEADLQLGRIEARRPDKVAQNSARERFKRVIEKYDNRELIPEAWLEIGRVDMKLERWEDAKNAFATINKNKRWLSPEERAESNYSYGVCLEKVGDLGGALQAYNIVWVSYTKYAEWATQAFEKVITLGFEDAEKNITDPIALRAKKIEYYKLLKKKVYEWQNFDTEAYRRLERRVPEMRTELGITPEEERQIDFDTGLDQVQQPEQGN